MTSKSPAKIQKRIQRIKAELSAIDAMRPGSLTRQYKDPKNKRGAYYQLSYTRERKSRTEYVPRSEEHTSELQSRLHLVCRLLLEKKKNQNAKPSCRGIRGTNY